MLRSLYLKDEADPVKALAVAAATAAVALAALLLGVKAAEAKCVREGYSECVEPILVAMVAVGVGGILLALLLAMLLVWLWRRRRGPGR